MHIGKSLSTLPHADDEERHPKFRETEEQGMPPAKRMCKQATKHGHHEHHQQHHSRREDRQDRHGRCEDRQDRHGRHKHRQEHHGRHEDRQGRHDRHGRHKHRQEHHGHHKHHQDRYGRQSCERYDHHFPPICSLHPFCQAHSHAPVQSRYLFEPFYQTARPSTLESSPHPSPDSPHGKYAAFLRDYYTRHQTPCTKWPQLNITNYINLAVISNDYANRSDLVKFREQTIHGSIDDILDWKAPIVMEDILKPNRVEEYDPFTYKEQIKEYPVTQLLIEGILTSTA